MTPFQHRSPDSPVWHSASEVNAWNAAALEHRGKAGRQTPAPPPGQLPPGLVWVKNTTGAQRSRFEVLALDDATLSDTDSDYKARPVFNGVQPDPENTPEHRSRVAILLEPVADDKFARAAIFGQGAMPVEVLDTGHTRARVLDDYTLQSGFFGPVRILSAPATGTDELCRVMIDGFDGGHCFAKVPGSGIGSGTWASPTSTTCTLAWPDPSTGAATEVSATKSTVKVWSWGPAIDDVDYVQCRIVGGRITPDVAYCDA